MEKLKIKVGPNFMPTYRFKRTKAWEFWLFFWFFWQNAISRKKKLIENAFKFFFHLQATLDDMEDELLVGPNHFTQSRDFDLLQVRIL